MRVNASVVAFAWVVAGFSLAPMASSAIILVGSEAERLGETDFYRLTIVARGTDGEIINTISGINLTGNVHQVFGAGETDSPSVNETGHPLWNPAWTPYDTHVLIPNSQRVGTVGMPLRETNGGQTTGSLGLPDTILGAPPKSGFGTLSSFDRSDSFALLPEAAGTEVAWLQVVSTFGSSPVLSVRIDAQHNGMSVNQVFQGFHIGSPNLPPVIPGGIISPAFPDQLLEFDFSVGTWDDGPLWALTWSLQGSQKNGADAVPVNSPLLNSATGEFTWVPDVADLMGESTAEWTFTVQATDLFYTHGVPGTGMLTITLHIPEPSSIWLVSLAAVGLTGFAGRRRRR